MLKYCFGANIEVIQILEVKIKQINNKIDAVSTLLNYHNSV